MSQFLHHNDNNNAKAIAIPRVFPKTAELKTLVTSIFSFSHYVFKSLLFQDHKKSGLCSKDLNLK